MEAFEFPFVYSTDSIGHPIGYRVSILFLSLGRDRVLAHPRMVKDDRRSTEEPLQLLRTFGDPVIADISALPALTVGGIRPPPGTLARVAAVGGESYFVFTREIARYGDLPPTL